MMNVWEEKHNVEKPGATCPLYKDIVSQDGQVGKVVPGGAAEKLIFAAERNPQALKRG
jgi:hypothetical protein